MLSGKSLAAHLHVETADRSRTELVEILSPKHMNKVCLIFNSVKGQEWKRQKQKQAQDEQRTRWKVKKWHIGRERDVESRPCSFSVWPAEILFHSSWWTPGHSYLRASTFPTASLTAGVFPFDRSWKPVYPDHVSASAALDFVSNKMWADFSSLWAFFLQWRIWRWEDGEHQACHPVLRDNCRQRGPSHQERVPGEGVRRKSLVKGSSGCYPLWLWTALVTHTYLKILQNYHNKYKPPELTLTLPRYSFETRSAG